MLSMKLTKSAVDSARPGTTDYKLRDTIVPGFFCKITAAGRKVFKRRMRAGVLDLPKSAAIRIVRFVLEDKRGPSVIEVVRPEGNLAAVLERIGQRLQVRLATPVVGQRELRVPDLLGWSLRLEG